jgi:methylenetetrahydrofolate reductase (NADPH)
MSDQKTELKKRIEAGKPLLLAEVSPPHGADPAPLRAAAQKYAGKVHALGISDNRDGVCMSALAAASLIASQGVEPILHMVTRDRNRIALISDCLGAQALGIGNLLCTTGTHQTLGPARAARNVFDIDSIQLLQALSDPSIYGSVVGEKEHDRAPALCLGATATPFADPMQLQIQRLDKKVRAGARFLITQPVFDLERFGAWWQEVRQCGIQQKAAFVAGIRLLTDADRARAYAAQRPRPMIPESGVLERLAAAAGKDAQRAAGIEIAVETIQRLSALEGLRGFEIRADGDDEAALAVMEKAKLKVD